MNAAEEKQIRIEIAANGFGEAVERHGFRKVGATHWRRDGDEVTWRVALVPAGYKRSPGCFHAVMGGLVHGLDELGAKVDGKPLSSPIQGLSARAHIHRNVGQNLYGDYHLGTWDPFDDDLPERIRHPETLRRKYRGRKIWKLPEGLRMFRAGQVIRHWKELSSTSSTFAFQTDGHDVTDVAQTVACYFEIFFVPSILRWTIFENVYEDFYGSDAPFFWPYNELENICAAIMAGDLDRISELIRPKLVEAVRSDEDMAEEFSNDHLILERLQKNHDLTLAQIIKNRRETSLRIAHRHLEYCRALEIVPPLSELEAAHLEAVDHKF